MLARHKIFIFRLIVLSILMAALVPMTVLADNNFAPVLAPIGDQTVDEGSELTFDANATDDDDPAQTLTFSLDAGAPAGATINPTTGVFSWTPTEAQGPDTYNVTVRVTDDGTPATLDDFETITITVNEVNNAPVLNPIGDKTVDERATLSFMVSATDTDTPPQTMIYFMGAGAPAAATLNPTSGQFSWTPVEADGGNVFNVTIYVIDLGNPVLLDSETFSITVNKTNSPPVLDPIGNKETLEGQTLSFTVTASDDDIPAQTLTYSLGAGAPAGATINPTTGEFVWAVGEVVNPNFSITIRVTDNGTPNLNDSETINVFVGGANVAPVLDPIGSKSVDEGQTLSFTATATDEDIPAQTLTFSLENAPAGASIVPATGLFTWTPTEVDASNIFNVTVKVTDSGNPNLSDSEIISITVNEVNAAPVLDTISDQQVFVGNQVTFDANATDSDLPANTLTFSLDAGAPAGAAIDPNTGVFTWTPDATGSFTVTVVVTDNGTPNLTDSQVVNIQIEEASLLSNAGFETPGAADKDAANWNEIGTKGKDKRICDSVELGDISPEGQCAWRFKRGAPLQRRIQAPVPIAGLGNGDTLEIEGMVKTANLVGGARIQVKAVYASGTPTKVNIPLPNGTNEYQAFTGSLTLTGTPVKIQFRVETRGSKGTFYVDALVVRKQAAGLMGNGAIVPVPASPELRGSN